MGVKAERTKSTNDGNETAAFSSQTMAYIVVNHLCTVIVFRVLGHETLARDCSLEVQQGSNISLEDEDTLN